MEWITENWSFIVVAILIPLVGLLQARGKINANTAKRVIRVLQVSRMAGGDTGAGANIIVGALRNNQDEAPTDVVEKLDDLVKEVKGKKRKNPLLRLAKLAFRAATGAGLRRL